MIAAVTRWLFAPLPRGRVAALRTFVYLFIFFDLFLIRPWVVGHGTVTPELYNPLAFGRLLHLPTPTPTMAAVVQAALVIATLVALTGRWPRAAGYVVFALYLQWMFIAFSYGKVDHDRIAFLVALAVLPSAGTARWADRTEDQAAGWAIRFVQITVVLTYFMSLFAKLRFGGINWVTGATLMRAVTRRGSALAEPLKDNPALLQASQYFIVIFEALSPLLFVRGRVGKIMLAVVFGFHVVTFAAIGIMFWPHVVCLMSFLPLERLDPRTASRRLVQACSRRLSTSRA